MENNNELMVQAQGLVMEGNSSFIADLTAPKTTAFSSVDITGGTPEEKKKFFNAINSTEKRIGDQINATINVKHVYVEVVTCTNPDTGEQKECPRTVLIDDKGNGYHGVSTGVFNSLKKIFQIYGIPSQWEKPLAVKVKQVTKGQNKILTLEMA